MLGLRGVRLGLIVPELYRIQVRAALEALRRRRQAGGDPRPEIMVPLVSTAEELLRVREMIDEERTVLFPDGGADIPVGTMIELPRAALLAGDIARRGGLLLFRNQRPDPDHLWPQPRRRRTQLPPLLPRGGDLPAILSRPWTRKGWAGWSSRHPRGKGCQSGLVVGLCGEHGGDPASIELCHRIGLDYVSCSPPRIPVARLAAAQAALGGRCPAPRLTNRVPQ